MGGSLGALWVEIGAKIDGWEKAAANFSKQIDATISDTQKKFSGFDKIGSTLTGFGVGLSATVTAPIVAIGAAAVKASGDFDSAMRLVSARGDITGTDLAKLKAQAEDLGAKTQFSSKQAAEGMAEFAGAGFKTQQIFDAMPATLDLAAAAQTDVGTAAKVAKDLLGQFGLSATDTQRAVDVLAKAGNEGSGTLMEMANSLKYVAPPARAAGLDIEQTAAALLTLDKAGVRGEQAGTALRAVLLSLQGPSKEAAGYLADLGIKTTDANGKMLPFAGIIEQFRTALAKIPNEAEKANALVQIFGKEAYTAAQVLTSAGAPALLDFEQKMRNAGGEAKRTADVMNSGMGGALERMRGSVETAAQKLGDVLAPTIIKLAGFVEQGANALAGFFEWFQKLPEPVQATALGITALAAAIGPALLVAGQLAGAVTSIATAAPLASKAIAAMGTAMTGAAATTLAWTGLIGVAAVAIYKVIDAYSKLRDAQTEAEKATKSQNDSLALLEVRLRTAGANISDYQKAYASGEYTLEQYTRKLNELAAKLSDSKKATTDHKTATDSLEDAQRKLAAQIASGVQSFTRDADEKKKSAAASYDLKRRDDELFETAKQLQQQYDKHVESLVKAKLALEDAAKSTPQMIAASDELNASIQKIASSVADASKQFEFFGDAVNRELAQALKPIQDIDAAYAKLGVTSSAALQRQADEARAAYETILADGTATARDIDAAWVAYEKARIEAARAAGEQIPEATLDALKRMEDALGQSTQRQKSVWSEWSNQVSTIVTDLSKDFSEAIIGIFKGDPQNDQLKEQEQELRASLAERQQEWETYQQNVAEQLEELRAKHAEELAAEEEELNQSLAERQQQYEESVADISAQLAEVRQSHADELAEEIADLNEALAEKEQAYNDYQTEVASRISELRQKHAEELQEELQDLRDALAEKQQSYEDYVSDIETKLGRLNVDTEDDIADEKRNTDRKVADKRKQYEREKKLLEQKIRDERAKGSKANLDQIRDWERTLAEKQEDTEEYIRRELEDYNDYVEEHRRKAEQQAEDYRTSLDRRTRDFQQYVSENRTAQNDAITSSRASLDREVADLQASLAERGTELERFRSETAAKVEERTAHHAAELAKEEADLQASLARQTAEWERFKTATMAKFDELRANAAVELSADETKLAEDLAKAQAEWEKYKNDTNLKLGEIESQFTGIWDRVGSAFGSMLESMGQAIIRFGTEYLEQKLFKWLVNDLLDGIFPRISKALTDIFGSAGAAVPGTSSGGQGGSGGIPGTSGGGAASTAGGALGVVNAVTGAVSAVADVVSAIGTVRLEGTMNAVEWNTRKSSLHLESILDHINLYLPKLESIDGYLWNTFTPALASLMTTVEGLDGDGTGGNVVESDVFDSPEFERAIDALTDIGLSAGKMIPLTSSLFEQGRQLSLQVSQVNQKLEGISRYAAESVAAATANGSALRSILAAVQARVTQVSITVTEARDASQTANTIAARLQGVGAL